MNLHKLILTKNACYKAGKTIIPQGIMVHSTGANNPYLKRYIGPDDELLGVNRHHNHWNQDQPDGQKKCTHGFIGKLKNGDIASYQTLPWNFRGWHCGSTGNNTHISFEICEDDLTNDTYFSAVYKEAVELCAYLCKLYNLTAQEIVCHSEGFSLGIASNHADVMHWFPKHGKSMDSLRADVAIQLEQEINHIDLDNTPSRWSKDAVNWALENKLLLGDENKNLKLHQSVTREELCLILKRFDDIK